MSYNYCARLLETKPKENTKENTMPTFGKKSLEKLANTHPDIQAVCNELIKFVDFTVLEGTRTQEQQQIYYMEGKSKLDGVVKKSKHQHTPSLAIDIAPYPIDFSDNEHSRARFYYLAGMFMLMASQMQITGKIKSTFIWGGDWNKNFIFSDSTFIDLPHFEIK